MSGLAPDPFDQQAAGQEPPLPPAGEPLPVLSPAERLAISRARMRGFLMERTAAGRRRRATVGDASALPGIDLLMAKLQEHPMAAAVVDAVTNWWKSHPVHAFGVILGSAARDAAGPLVRRHPIAAVAAAVVGGALLLRMRPWRLVLKSALFAGLASQVASRLVSAVPLDTVMAALMKFTGGKPANGGPPP
ncbi:MAG: hypothetical protein ACK4PH_25990 [Aquincola tertiaricarbonis]